MLVVHSCKGEPGQLEIAWTWFPWFIASNKPLHQSVDAILESEFRGQELSDVTLSRMHRRVIQIVTAEYRIQGLSAYLAGLDQVQVGGT